MAERSRCSTLLLGAIDRDWEEVCDFAERIQVRDVIKMRLWKSNKRDQKANEKFDSSEGKYEISRATTGGGSKSKDNRRIPTPVNSRNRALLALSALASKKHGQKRAPWTRADPSYDAVSTSRIL